MKKFLIIVGILGFVSFAGAWFAKKQVKGFVKKYPAIYTFLQKGANAYREFRFSRSSLGNLNNNETMTSARLVVDFNSEIGEYEKFWQGLGQDSFRDGFLHSSSRAYYEMIGEMNKVRPVFTSAHSKGMLCDTWFERRGERTCGEVYTQSRDGSTQYNWQIADEVHDLILKNGMRPLVSFTYMPSALASDPDNVNPWNRAIVSPPADYSGWQDLIYNTVLHFKERYGTTEISNWYFEVWNEPDLPRFFWIVDPEWTKHPQRGDKDEYIKLYDYTVAGALQAEPRIKVGGPGLAGDIDFFLKDWLPHSQSGRNLATGEKGTRVDFLSVHCYGNIEEKLLPKMKRFIDTAKDKGGKITKDADFVITEYGPIAQPKRWLNSRYVAAWLVKFVDGIFYLGAQEGAEYVPDMMYFWTKPIPPAFNDHFGVVTAFGHPKNLSALTLTKRPAFNGFDALSRLGSMRVTVEGSNFGDPIHAIATKSDDNSVQVIVYHLDESDQYNQEEQTYPVYLTLKNLPFSSFQSELYLIDRSHSNAFAIWEEMGAPANPLPPQVEQLQNRDDLELVESKYDEANNAGIYQKNLELQNNSVALLVLTARKERSSAK